MKNPISKILKYNNILVEDPNMQSMASMVLLKIKYTKMDKDSFNFLKWKKVRSRFLKNKKEYTCIHCGVKLNKERITIDHIISTSKGGAMYDENNFSISCFKCNKKRGNEEYTCR